MSTLAGVPLRDAGEPAGAPAPPSRRDRTARVGRQLVERVRAAPVESWITVAVVAACAVFVFVQLQPGLIFRDTTPNGGDMGAHVWGPAYLRDVLLPSGQLSGWTGDWYAGFPAYAFYMVLPSLAIVLVDVVLPYGVAFKLVSVAGLVGLPVACWALGRLGGIRFPGPAAMAGASLLFVFDRSFTIYGGNAASTLAGEFAYSIGLALAVLTLGVVAWGLRTGRGRVLAVVLVAVTALCHLIPAVFLLVGMVALLITHPGRARAWWLATVAAVAGALTAWWALPFLGRSAYLTDMGWEKITDYQSLLLPKGTATWSILGLDVSPPDFRWFAVLALVGAVLAVVVRDRLGMALALMAVTFAAMVRYMPQHRLWNARLAPFWYLCVYLLAALAFVHGGRLVARWWGGSEGSVRRVRAVSLGLWLAAVFVLVGIPLRAMPGGSVGDDGLYHWMGIATADSSFVRSWATWNYSGYEAKAAYPEYHDIVETMAAIGRDQGCGRAMWEYDESLNNYGTPMAMMLLPFWTDGCIGSMEGLFFESSATTPYHFLNQSELSASPSRAMRDLPYGPQDLSLGVQHLQMLGVRYYLTYQVATRDLARQQPALTELATSGPWTVFEVAGSDLVAPLSDQPAVVPAMDESARTWLDGAVSWYLDPERWDVPLAADGPSDWQRVSGGESPLRVPLPSVAVSDIRAGQQDLSFTVDKIGVPVLVKESYFPNWHAEGAIGPYRVAPNQMVVIPTSTEVHLSYGTTGLDTLAWTVTVVGILGLLVLAMRPRMALAPLPDDLDAVLDRHDREDAAALAAADGDDDEVDEPDDAYDAEAHLDDADADAPDADDADPYDVDPYDVDADGEDDDVGEPGSEPDGQDDDVGSGPAGQAPPS